MGFLRGEATLRRRFVGVVGWASLSASAEATALFLFPLAAAEAFPVTMGAGTFFRLVAAPSFSAFSFVFGSSFLVDDGLAAAVAGLVSSGTSSLSFAAGRRARDELRVTITAGFGAVGALGGGAVAAAVT